jgi:hypothetical protein
MLVKRENFQKRLDRVRKMKAVAEANAALVAKQLEKERVSQSNK